MAIFKINKNKVTKCTIKDAGFGGEFSLRDFFAENLEELLGIRFIVNEYPIQEGRIDTLGLDENNTPVIIEYKWKENEEVLAQGLFYYNWLVKNKKHFELLVDNKLGKSIKINWEQPRVLLIARGFGRYILGAVEQEKHIELLSYHYYEPDILHLESIYSPSPIKTTVRNKKITDSTYNLNHHINKTNQELQNLFMTLRERILQLPEVEERSAQKSGITYRTTRSFIKFEFTSNSIRILIRDKTYSNDTKKIVTDIEGHNWGYLGLIKMDRDIDLEYLFQLIKDSYESTL